MIHNDVTKVVIDQRARDAYPYFDDVFNALVKAYKSGERCRLYLGNKETGRVWKEEHNVVGYVRMSTGAPYHRCFILVYNNNSLGGVAIIPSMIVAIQEVKSKRYLFKHPKLNFEQITVDGDTVYDESGIYATCQNERLAQRLCAFLMGKRMTL